MELAGKHEPLIGTQLARRLLYPSQLVAHQHELLDVGAAIRNRHLRMLMSVDGQGRQQRSLNRAATAKCPTDVANSREVTKLKRVRYVLGAGERPTATDAREQLEGRLAVAVFEIGGAQQMPIRAK